MPALQRISAPELKGLYANANRYTQPKGTVPRISNLYMIRRGAFHSIPGSQWLSSFDGLAPHSTTQKALKSLTWYSPSPTSGPAVYMTGQPQVNNNNYVVSIQLASVSNANLIDVSVGTFATLASGAVVTQPTTTHGYQLSAIQFSDYLITALGNSVDPAIFPTVTLTAGAIGIADVTIPVVSTLPFPNAGYFMIGTEAIQYTSKTATSFGNCVRGSLGTAAAVHASGVLATYGINNAGAFLAQVWHSLDNNFDPTTIYGPWPGSINNTAGVAVNIGTVIVAFDGNNNGWPFRAQNSGFTAFGTNYAGPQFWPGGVYGVGNMTAASDILTAATPNAPFTSSHVGLPVTVQGAGAGGGALTTTVKAPFIDASHVHLTVAASTTVTGAQYSIGTGNAGDLIPDHNAANNSGSEVWLNIGRATFPPPGAAFVFQHLNFLFLWGVGATYGVDGVSGPDALWQSEFGIPNQFDPANITFVGKGDGTEAQGGAVLSLSEAGIAATPQLVLFKDAATYVFLNAFPNASIVQTSGGLGCIAPGTIQYIGGYGVMRLSYMGFTLFDGQTEHVTEYTDAIQQYLYGSVDLTQIDFANIQNSVSCQVTNPPMYVAFLPLTGGTGFATRGFAYDFALKQWTIIDLPFAVSAASFNPQAAVAGSQGYSTLVGGSIDGAVRRLFAGDPTFDSTLVSWSMVLPQFGTPGTPVYVRRMNMHITADGGGVTPAFSSIAIVQMQRSGQQKSRTLNVPSTIFGSVDVGLTMITGAVVVNGAGQVVIEGYDYQISEKPMSRVGL